MPDAFDLAKRVRDVAEETMRQAESLRLRAERARKAEGVVSSAASEMFANAREREADGSFLRDLADSIESHGAFMPGLNEIAKDCA